MTYTLRYLDHDYNYQSWIFQAAGLDVAEILACEYCNRDGYTYADITLLEVL